MPLLAFDDNSGLVPDVIRMSQAGVGDDTIIAYILHTSGRFDVTADDVIAMTQANVSPKVIRALIDESRNRIPPERPAEAQPGVMVPQVDRDPTPPWTAFYDPWWFMPRMYTPLPSTRPSTR